MPDFAGFYSKFTLMFLQATHIKYMVFLEQSERKNAPNIKVLNNLSTRSHL